MTANPTPIKIGTATDGDPIILIPVPANSNSNSMDYTKPEAILILSHNKKGLPIRGKLMCKMIGLRYTPTTVKIIQQILQLNFNGEIIPDDPW